MASSRKKNKSRLHIGVVVPSPDNTHKYDLLSSIIRYAEKHDVHLTAYFGSYVSSNIAFASHYEPCFEAIRNSTSLDGAIIFSGFIAHNMGYDVFKRCVEAIPESIPIVSIGLQLPGFLSVMADNESGMYKAVEHLILRHDRRKIAFIKGPEGHPEAEARFRGYQKALADNGIELDENLLCIGNFTPDCGNKAIAELVDVRKVDFDGIACCNDENAFGVFRALMARKIPIPEKVSVVAFDDVEEAARTVPPLSTMKQDFSAFGAVAAEMLCDIAKGKQVEQNKLVSPTFVARQSCGCTKTKRKMGKYIHDISNQLLLHRSILDNIVLHFDLDDLADELHGSLPRIGIRTALVGLYKSQIASGRLDASRTIDTMIGFDEEQRFSIKNNSWNPILFSDYSSIDNYDFDRERRTLFYLPLFFANEEAGIALMSYSEHYPIVSYEALKRAICAAVRGAALLSQVQMLSVTDELTGLYNRRGFFQQVYSRLTLCSRENDLVPVVLVMDMDGLKLINDTYGHSEGDAAINNFAKVLLEALRETDIVGRIGGDEFAAFSLIKSEDNVEALLGRLRTKFDEYNTEGLHPYKVSGSVGAVVLKEATKESFNEALQNADEVLYEEKMEKKKLGLSR